MCGSLLAAIFQIFIQDADSGADAMGNPQDLKSTKVD